MPLTINHGREMSTISGNVLWYIPNKEIHSSPQDLIAQRREKLLLAFYTISSCDATSQFPGIGKQSALKIFDSSSKLIEHLGEHCPPEESVMADAEAFVCQLYNHGTDGVDINEERAAAFPKNLIPFLRRILCIFIYGVRTSSA